MRNIERLHERAENMRLKPTFHEKKFKERLEIAEIYYKSQKVIGNYIVDFVVGNKIIEIDGESHFEEHQAVYDKQRTYHLNKCGYEVIRVRNEHVVSFDMNRLKTKRKKVSIAPKIVLSKPVKETIADILAKRREIQAKPDILDKPARYAKWKIRGKKFVKTNKY